MNPRDRQAGHLIFIDNIRIVLICLVILTHLAITYGAYGKWFYNEVAGFSPETAILTLIPALSQSFMMGFFFLIAAYFIPPSLARKGTRRFLSDRLIRLGIPLIAWIMVIGPVLRYYVAMKTGDYAGSLSDWYQLGLTHPSIYGLGPLWFVLALLVFTLLYLVWTLAMHKNLLPEPGEVPPLAWILLAGFLIGLASFIVRIFLPIGSSWEFFEIQVPFFPQYIALFLIGIYASRGGWFTRVPEQTGRACIVLAVALACALPVLLVATGALSGSLAPLLGGFYWQSLAYSIWEQIFAVLVITALLWGFRTRFDHAGTLFAAAAGATYTVYIIHPIVIIPLTLALQGILLSPLVKFALAAALSLPLCFLVAILVRAVPGVDRVL